MHLLQWRKLAWRCLTTWYYLWITHILMQMMAMSPTSSLRHRCPPSSISNYYVTAVESGRSMQQLEWNFLLVNLPLWSCTLLTFVLESRATVAARRHGHNHLRSMPLTQIPSLTYLCINQQTLLSEESRLFYFISASFQILLRVTSIDNLKSFRKVPKIFVGYFFIFWESRKFYVV